MASGLAIGLSFVAAEVVHDKVFPLIHSFDKLSEPISAGVSAGMTGGSNVLVHTLYNSQSVEKLGISKLLLVGAGSEVLGDYLYSKFIGPTILGEEPQQ